MVRVRAVILGFRSADTLPAAVGSLLDQDVLGTDVRLEIVVVLNGASEQVRRVATTLPPGVRLINSDTNRGFAGGCNLGAATAAGEPAPDFLVFFNDDAVAAPDWLRALLDFAGGRPEAGVIGSRLRFPDGAVQDAGGVLLRDGHPAMVGRGWPEADERIAFARRVDYVSAAAILVRREAFEAVGGFDEGYFPAYYEDADLCLRLAAAGWQSWYLPTAEVVHAESASSAHGRKERIADRNERRFLQRWHHLLPDRVPRGPADEHRIFLAAQARRGGHRRVLVDSGAPSPVGLALELAAAGARVDLLSAAVHDEGSRRALATAGVRVIPDRTVELGRPTGMADLVLAGTTSDRDLLRRLRPEATVTVLTRTPPVGPDLITLVDRLIGRTGTTPHRGSPPFDSEADMADSPSTEDGATVQYLTDALALREAELLIARERVRELQAELARTRAAR